MIKQPPPNVRTLTPALSMPSGLSDAHILQNQGDNAPLPRSFAGEGGAHRTPHRGVRWEGEGVPARSGAVADAAVRALSVQSHFAGNPHPPNAWPAKRAGQALGPSLSRKRERVRGEAAANQAAACALSLNGCGRRASISLGTTCQNRVSSRSQSISKLSAKRDCVSR